MNAKAIFHKFCIQSKTEHNQSSHFTFLNSCHKAYMSFYEVFMHSFGWVWWSKRAFRCVPRSWGEGASKTLLLWNIYLKCACVWVWVVGGVVCHMLSDNLAAQKASLTVVHCIIFHQRASANARTHACTHARIPFFRIDSWKGQSSVQRTHTLIHAHAHQTHLITLQMCSCPLLVLVLFEMKIKWKQPRGWADTYHSNEQASACSLGCIFVCFVAWYVAACTCGQPSVRRNPLANMYVSSKREAVIGWLWMVGQYHEFPVRRYGHLCDYFEHSLM